MEIDRELLKQSLRGEQSCNQIAKARGCSHNTVRRAKRLLTEAGVTEDQIDLMSDSDIAKILYPKRLLSSFNYPNLKNEVGYIEQGYTLYEAHARYVEETTPGYAIAYSTYCDRIRRYLHSQETEFRHIHIPGEDMQIDYGGKRPTGKENGKPRKFELFVSVLPASHMIFGVCTRSQSTEDTIEASILALEYYGGVPLNIVSDNLKAVVIGRKSGIPVINKRYQAFADYYKTQVDPTRVASPKDKASVEVAVKLVQKRLNLRLKNRPPLNLCDMNKVLRELIDELNARTMKRGGESRIERFERLDQKVLKTLPAERLSFLEAPVKRRVPKHYHIPIDNVHYSVPSNLVGQIVTVRQSRRTVEIRHDGLLITTHDRRFQRDAFVTHEKHRPENHKAFIEVRFNNWLSNLPKPVREIVKKELSKSPGMERLRIRVIKLQQEFGYKRFQTACTKAITNKSLDLKHVKNLLVNRRETIKSQQDVSELFRPTKNVRGSDYFEETNGNDGDDS